MFYVVIIIEMVGPLILAIGGYLLWGWLGVYLGFLVGRSLVAIPRGYRTGPYLGTNEEFMTTAWLDNNFSFSLIAGVVLGFLIGIGWFGAIGAVLGLIVGPILFWVSYQFFAVVGMNLGKAAKGPGKS